MTLDMTISVTSNSNLTLGLISAHRDTLFLPCLAPLLSLTSDLKLIQSLPPHRPWSLISDHMTLPIMFDPTWPWA